VIAIIPFKDEEDAIKIANDTIYGLSAFMHSTDEARIKRVTKRLRAGSVNINGAAADYDVPFGGYKASGNGKENGPFGMHDYLDTKAVNR
jgi:aldehyde dehydrogenase (NAD+)